LKGLLQTKSDNKDSQLVIGVIPSYHHLKRVLFELSKEQEFKENFSLSLVVTKINAKHFYFNKHRNTRQFVLENCLKGICDLVILERGYFP